MHVSTQIPSDFGRRAGQVLLLLAVVSLLAGLGTEGTFAQSPLVLESPNDGDQFGDSIAKVGDVNGNGTSDVIVGAPSETINGNFGADGRVYLIEGSDGSIIRTLTDTDSGRSFGFSVADVQAPDGSSYVAVATANLNIQADVFETELIRLINASDGSVVQAFTSQTFTNIVLTDAGDINGDGSPDVLVGSPADTVDGAAGAGRAHVLGGGDGETLFTLTSPNPTGGENLGAPSNFGTSVAGGMDFNGDGTPDLVVGAPDDSESNGRVYLFDGANGTVIETIASQSTYNTLGSFGASVANAGDVNADGTPDILVGAPTEDAFVDGSFLDTAGRLHLISGADGSVLQMIPSSEGGVWLGRSVTSVGDVNADGVPDVAAGAPGGFTEGPVHIFSGTGGILLGTLPPPIAGDDLDFGLVLAGVGDTDGDQVPDIAVGLSQNPNTDGEEGRAYIFSGSDLFLAGRFSQSVSADGLADFDSTGINVNFSGVSGTGEVTVKRYGLGPREPSGITEENVSEYRATIGQTGDLTFNSNTEVQFEVGSFPGIEDPATVTVYNRPSEGQGTFSSLPTNVDDNGTPNNPSDDVILATTGSFSEFVLASDTDPLPVELATFDAAMDGTSAQLTWQTATETNNSGFDVQRREGEPGQAEGSWTTVGFVEGAGTTSEPQSYRFTDTELPYDADRLTYRLRQVDTDGTTTLSDPVVVERSVDKVELLGTFPNPASQQATVRYALPAQQDAQIRLYDALGRQVRTIVNAQKEGRHEETIDVSGLSSGTYFLQLQAEGQAKTQQLTVTR